MRIATLLLLLAVLPCFAQGSATLTCTPPTTNTDGSAITQPISYKFYSGTIQGTYPDSRSVTACNLVWDALSEGTHYFVATAIVGGVESVFSNSASKTIAAQPAPTPTRVTSTRIEAAEWTCRDANGVILTSHTRQDKAQEECTNRALANPGVTYEIRPSGYRIIAQ